MSSREETLREIQTGGVIAIIRTDRPADLMEVVEALARGGLRCVEVTMTTPGALEAVREAARTLSDRCVIGVGSVLDSETARSAILAGARFVVAPIVERRTIELCRRYGVAVLPGGLTPTEIVSAWQWGRIW